HCMDKRTLLAAALMALVIVLTPRIFSSRSAPAPSNRADTTAVVPAAPANTASAVTQAPPAASPKVDTSRRATPPITKAASITTPRATFALMNPGAAPGEVTIPSFKDLRPRDDKGAPVVIAPAGKLHMIYRLAAGADTIALDTLLFTVAEKPNEVTFSSAPIELSYRPTSDGFRLSVSGRVNNAVPGATLVIDLPS